MPYPMTRRDENLAARFAHRLHDSFIAARVSSLKSEEETLHIRLDASDRRRSFLSEPAHYRRPARRRLSSLGIDFQLLADHLTLYVDHLRSSAPDYQTVLREVRNVACDPRCTFDRQVLVWDAGNITIQDPHLGEDVNLGDFTIALYVRHYSALREETPCGKCLAAIITSDSSNPYRPGYIHPHISPATGALCRGPEGNTLLAALSLMGCVAGVLDTLTSILRTYNPDDPYVELYTWLTNEGDPLCFDCGICQSDAGDEGALIFARRRHGNSVYLCSECADGCFCRRCAGIWVYSDLEPCGRCSVRMCPECPLTTCPGCGLRVCGACSTAMYGGLCFTCLAPNPRSGAINLSYENDLPCTTPSNNLPSSDSPSMHGPNSCICDPTITRSDALPLPSLPIPYLSPT